MPELLFDRACLDTERRTLTVGGESVDIQPLVFDLLSYLARYPQRVVPKAELLGAVWRSPHVTDSVVARAVMKARRALEDDATTPRLLRTMARVGYQLDAAVTERKIDIAPPPVVAISASLPSLAVLPVSQVHFAPGEDWPSLGLMGLLRHLLDQTGSFALASNDDVNTAWKAAHRAADPVAHVRQALGVEATLRCELVKHEDHFSLHASLRESRDERTFAVTGHDPIAAASKLADELRTALLLPQAAAADPFWHEQLARALAAFHGGRPAQGLELIRAAEQHLTPTGPLGLLRAQMLYQCGKLSEAEKVAEQTLAMPDVRDQPQLRLQLLVVQAACDLDTDLLPRAQERYQAALDLSASLPSAQALRPELLCQVASVAARRGLDLQALQQARAATEEADALGRTDLRARAWIKYANTLIQMDYVERAAQPVQRALDFAAQSGADEHQARAFRLQADLQMARREYAACLESSRRSVVLWVRSGNVPMRIWAQFMELLALIELKRLVEARQYADQLLAQGAMQEAQEGFLRLMVAHIDWLEGHDSLAVESLSTLARPGSGGHQMTSFIANAELVFMLAHLNDLAGAQAALQAVAGMPTHGAMARRRAALALAAGDRATALQLLREQWTAAPMRGFEGQNITLELTWLLLEDSRRGDESPELDALFAHVADLSMESSAVRLVHAAYLLRKAPSSQTRVQWREAVARATGLERRAPELVGEGYARALESAQPPRLRELITRVC